MHLQNAYSWELCKYIFSHFLFHVKSHGWTTDGNFLAYHYENCTVNHFEIDLRKRSLSLWPFREFRVLRTGEKKVLEHACPCGRHLRRKWQLSCSWVPSCTILFATEVALTLFSTESHKREHACVWDTPGVKCSSASPAVAPPSFSHSKMHAGMLGSENNDIWGLIFNSF